MTSTPGPTSPDERREPPAIDAELVEHSPTPPPFVPQPDDPAEGIVFLPSKPQDVPQQKDQPEKLVAPPVPLYIAEDVVDTDVVESDVVESDVVVPKPGLFIRSWRRLCSAVEWCFGVASLFAALSLLATLPILQLLSLGYLLEASGRISRSGRLRDGFVGVRKAARVGSIVLGTWLWLWPLRLLSELWYASHLIDPDSSITAGWRFALLAFTVLVTAHIVWAWYRGGRLRHFLWPAPIQFCRRLIRGGKYVEARDAVYDFVVSLRLPYYFWLGARGFFGAMAWLFLPILLYIGATELPGPAAFISGTLGVLSLMVVLIPLPFLQANFARRRQFAAMFDLLDVGRQFLRAPMAFWFALFITLLFALPLYLLKVELLQREVAVIPAMVFIAFIFPARLLTGWAVGRATRRQEVRFSVWRLITCFGSFGGALPVVAIYIFIVFFTRYTSWYGSWSLFEQHAFLVPVPFLGM